MRRWILIAALVVGCEPLDSTEPYDDVDLDPSNRGTCEGCVERGVCRNTTTVDACGTDGEACYSCKVIDPCKQAFCLDGACAVFIAPDNTPCGEDLLAICTAGVCAPP